MTKPKIVEFFGEFLVSLVGDFRDSPTIVYNSLRSFPFAGIRTKKLLKTKIFQSVRFLQYMALVGGNHAFPISFHLENIPNKKTKPLQQRLTGLENPCMLVSVVPQNLFEGTSCSR